MKHHPPRPGDLVCWFDARFVSVHRRMGFVIWVEHVPPATYALTMLEDGRIRDWHLAVVDQGGPWRVFGAS